MNISGILGKVLKNIIHADFFFDILGSLTETRKETSKKQAPGSGSEESKAKSTFFTLSNDDEANFTALVAKIDDDYRASLAKFLGELEKEDPLKSYTFKTLFAKKYTISTDESVLELNRIGEMRCVLGKNPKAFKITLAFCENIGYTTDSNFLLLTGLSKKALKIIKENLPSKAEINTQFDKAESSITSFLDEYDKKMKRGSHDPKREKKSLRILK